MGLQQQIVVNEGRTFRTFRGERLENGDRVIPPPGCVRSRGHLSNFRRVQGGGSDTITNRLIIHTIPKSSGITKGQINRSIDIANVFQCYI